MPFQQFRNEFWGTNKGNEFGHKAKILAAIHLFSYPGSWTEGRATWRVGVFCSRGVDAHWLQERGRACASAA
jgi:hypothetical protein